MNQSSRCVLKRWWKKRKIDKFSNYISELLSLADGKTYRNFDEKYINLLYFYILLPRKGFRVYNELKAGNGYADLVLKGNKGFTNYDIVVEFKYIKKEDYNPNILNKKREEAIEQLKRYKQDRRLSNNILRCYAIIFVGNELKLIEEV